jgi:spore photoproduct lyase
MQTTITCKEAVKTLKKGNINDKSRYKTLDSLFSIELKNTISLDSKIQPTFSKVADGSIITLFDKTPFPKKEDDVVCPHFIELKWANGCNFDCAWCYLNGTLRFRPIKKKPYLKDKTKIINHIKTFIEQNDKPSLLNSGELSDSLLFEGTENAISNFVIDLFLEQTKHKLLLLTKSNDIKGILNSNSQEVLIVSYSINAFDVSKRWEKGAPSPKDRILSAKKLKDNGYNIRFRIDPIIPVKSWKKDYKELIDFLFENLTPDLITLGSLRGLQSTINNSKDRSWVKYLDDKSNWGKKISFEKRYKMYNFMIQYLKEEYNYTNVGLCKETVKIWEKLNLDYHNIKCNCIYEAN